MRERPIRPIRTTIPSPERFETGAAYLLWVLNALEVPITLKIRAAIALLPFEGKKKQADAAADEASQGIFAPGAPPRMQN